MSEMHYMKLSDDFEKELREKGNTVTKSQLHALFGGLEANRFFCTFGQ